MREWLFKHLFRREWEELHHLTGDVIRLEREKKEGPSLTVTGSSNTTTYHHGEVTYC